MTATNTHRVLDWSHADVDLRIVRDVLAIANPGREPSDGYIRFMIDKAFAEGLESYMGTGGWYVTVFRTTETRDDGKEVWRPHVTLMPYTIAKHIGIKTH